MTSEKRAAFRSVVRATGNGYCASGCSGISIERQIRHFASAPPNSRSRKNR
ncbi:MAG: hypothetical protein OCU20_03475 [Methanophagales archaeon]|nr:hypothetical protein [Methanophagales archaeon]MCW3138564.1 hypothetical protein [Methanophagales archaeon]MCW7069858.1 hypothetical protein [Methanophagales archaeon]MCW7072943.1 hypothetical protein [Methanophagales archaeon]